MIRFITNLTMFGFLTLIYTMSSLPAVKAMGFTARGCNMAFLATLTTCTRLARIHDENMLSRNREGTRDRSGEPHPCSANAIADILSQKISMEGQHSAKGRQMANHKGVRHLIRTLTNLD